MEFPFQIVASGILPQGLSPGGKAPNTCLCTAINGGTGTWQITADDPTITPENSELIAFPGSGSNVPGGISFGQASQSGRVFLIESYSVLAVGEGDPGDPIDITVNFIIVKFPPLANAGDASP